MKGTHCPPAIHFFVKIAIFELLYISSSLKQISTKLRISTKFSMVNLLMGSGFHFT